MWVKFCANTNLEDALAAAELGADAVGFVFAPSKRQVNAVQVAAITPYLPASVERVGVFSGDDVESIAATVEASGLTAVQMHGGVDLALAHRLQARLGPQVSVIATTHWTITPDGDEASERAVEEKVAADMKAIAAEADPFRLLVDAKVGKASGGLGVAYDWSRARPILTSQPNLHVIVAGGLKPETVAEAIRKLQPWGVDVASGVESEPGKKSYEKMKSFIEAARGAV